MPITIADNQVVNMLGELLARDISVERVPSVPTHPTTYRGLVTDNNVLMAVIGGDVSFAHRSGAALAMIPATALEDKGDEPDDDLIEVYGEVANVLSRLVNEATPSRVRLDPGMEHSADELQAIVDSGDTIVSCNVSIDGYGTGAFGIWHRSN